MSANVASAMRSPFQLSVFVRVRTHCIARCQRSVPMSRTRIDVDPSISSTMSTPGLRTIAVMPCGLDNARMVSDRAAMSASQKPKSPTRLKRS